MSATKASQPRYLRIVEALERKIAADRYAVGEKLPSEHDLCAEFGVSRFTVRQAIGQLRAAGLVSPRQGAGTVVASRHAAPIFVLAVASVEELQQYARSTRLRLSRFERVVANAALARRLRTSRGQEWLRAEGLRFAPGNRLPLCWTEVFVRGEYTPVRGEKVARTGRIFSFLESECGETIGEVEQHLSAALVPEELAARLQAPAGAPALLVERRYLSLRRRVIEVAFSLHPADRFSYAMRMRREVAGVKEGKR